MVSVVNSNFHGCGSLLSKVAGSDLWMCPSCGELVKKEGVRHILIPCADRNATINRMVDERRAVIMRMYDSPTL